MATKTKPAETARPSRLQIAVRSAIEKHGLAKTAKNVGVMPATLQRFAFMPVGISHRGTVALVTLAYEKGLLT